MGRPGAGGEICACKIPHAHCLEVRLYGQEHCVLKNKLPKLNDERKLKMTEPICTVFIPTLCRLFSVILQPTGFG